MVRPMAVTSIAMVCLCASACESVLGSVDVSSAPRPEQTTRPLGTQPERPAPPPSETPAYFQPVPPPSLPPTAPTPVGSASGDAGVPPPVAPADGGQPEPAPPPVVVQPRPVLVDGPVATLERIGV